jgi:hypothetical protein
VGNEQYVEGNEQYVEGNKQDVEGNEQYVEDNEHCTVMDCLSVFNNLGNSAVQH